MGTLQHLLAHFTRTDTEPLDSRSVGAPAHFAREAVSVSRTLTVHLLLQNLLYFPLPSISDLERASAPPIYISAHYPEVYRQYLAGLVKVLDPNQ